MKTTYKVVVDITIREKGGVQLFEGATVRDYYPKEIEHIMISGENVSERQIEARAEALIAGLANCMYLAEKIKYKKTHESMKDYISQLEKYFSMPCMELKPVE